MMVIKEGTPTIRYTCRRCGCVWEVGAKVISDNSGVCPNCSKRSHPMLVGQMLTAPDSEVK